MDRKIGDKPGRTITRRLQKNDRPGNVGGKSLQVLARKGKGNQSSEARK